MITTTVKENNKREYPCLMINKDKDTLLYITGEGRDGLEGFALKGPNGPHYSRYWTSNQFELFEGEITLKNS